MSERAFGRTTVRWVVGIAVVSFIGGLALSIFRGDMKEVQSRGADTFSRSAIGHLALYRLLEELDIPVIASRHASAAKAAGESVLVIAEPHHRRWDDASAKALQKLIDAHERVLLVLPKWEASVHRTERGWVERLRLKEPDVSNEILSMTVTETEIATARRGEEGAWTMQDPFPDPSFPLPVVQLMEPRGMDDLVACEAGVLLAQMRHGEDGWLIVLSDPDVLANAGLGRGANATLVVNAIERLRGSTGAVIIDETIHGHAREDSVWRELFSYPLVVLMVHGMLVVCVLLWSAMGRYGTPVRPAPVFAPGHHGLIETTSELLRFRGHLRSVLGRFLRGTVRSVRLALHAPAGLRGPELAAWLDRVAGNRGVRDRLGALQSLVTDASEGRARPAAALIVAQRIHRWKQEILHGP